MTLPAVREVGEVRPSQLLYTYGVGSIIDLPNISVMVMGLEDWDRSKMTATASRDFEAVQKRLGPQVKALLTAARQHIELEGLPSEDLPTEFRSRFLAGSTARRVARSPPFRREPSSWHDRWRPDCTGYQHTYCPVPNGTPAFPARFHGLQRRALTTFRGTTSSTATDCPGPRLDNGSFGRGAKFSVVQEVQREEAHVGGLRRTGKRGAPPLPGPPRAPARRRPEPVQGRAPDDSHRRVEPLVSRDDERLFDSHFGQQARAGRRGSVLGIPRARGVSRRPRRAPQDAAASEALGLCRE
jgi:hypothetical protein